MAMQNQVAGTDGIVSDDVDSSIANLCALASRAMQHTGYSKLLEIMEEKARRNAGEKQQAVNA